MTPGERSGWQFLAGFVVYFALVIGVCLALGLTGVEFRSLTLTVL